MVGTSHRVSTLPASARDSSPALSIPPSVTLGFLTRIEQLPKGSTGALVFRNGDTIAGSVLIEQGRVCWAVATMMKQRLTDIMRFQRDPPVASEVVEEVYLECRTSGRPLGETLLKRGVVTEMGLRSAIRQHSAEAVALLSFPGSACSWHPRTSTSYDPRFTFSACELMVTLGALMDVESARLARVRLRAVLSDHGHGAGFIDAGQEPIPVAEVGEGQLSVEDMHVLGDWLRTYRDKTTSLSEAPRVVGGFFNNGQTLVGWFEGHLSYVALCESNAGAAHVMGRVMR